MNGMFKQVIEVHISLGRQRTIASVEQAIVFLLDWSSRRQGAHFYTALDACAAAQRGRATVAAAQEAFRQFAEHVGILVYDEDCIAA